MAQQQQNPLNMNAAPANPQAAAPPRAPGRENVPLLPTDPTSLPRPTISPLTLGPHNGYLTRHINRQLHEAEYPQPETTPDWPFRGPDGPLLRTRIAGNDELVFGSF
ncbi:hypothetical protein TRAPUB_2721 [Trametes pubescens]|uniref:Uncharacterized protein n=1 Tax=Trametes pubescens TaxID=154538 RepID=A0A1M2VFV6_TRAPU|nr:hypothetical protein TRAPUB_2721 [Trametes pubescens]